MNDPLHQALRDTQADLESVSTHLALIRETIEHGESAPTREELARRIAVSLVATLGFERVAIVLLGDDGELSTVAAYGQTERFGGAREPRRAWPPRLARDVLDQGTLIRWGGEGVGARRRRPRDLDEDVIGLPLESGGEILGAAMCTEIAIRPWTLARHRSLELIGQCIAQVMALQRGREEVEGAKQALELRLQAAQTKLQSQDERIDTLSSSLDVADRVKQTFLGLLSHELRTPLAAMLGYAGLLRDGDAGPVTADQDGFLARLETNGRRLGYLLDDLLFLTEAESTRIRPSESEVDLAALVETVRNALPKQPDGPCPRLEVDIAPGADRLRGDPALLRRLLFHLLDDAWHASPGGVVTLEAREAERGNVLLRVHGDGPPLDEPGLGIGQSIVRLCVSLQRGRCRLVPSSHDGPRAEVWIPGPTKPAKTTLAGRRDRSGDPEVKPKPKRRRSAGRS